MLKTYSYFNKIYGKFARIRLIVDANAPNPSNSSRILLENVDYYNKKVLDVGCGTGVCAIGAKMFKAKNVSAIDIDKNFVLLAKINSKLNKVDLNIFESDLFENVSGKYDIIISNPPCIPSHKRSKIYSGGEDGWVILDRLISQAPKHLKNNGSLIIVFSSLAGLKKLKNKVGSFEILYKCYYPFREFYEIGHLKSLSHSEYLKIGKKFFEIAYLIKLNKKYIGTVINNNCIKLDL